jgi:beta-galactosidase
MAVTDDQGRVVPTAGNLIDLDLAGPGRILGVGNGDPSCHEPDTYIPAAKRHKIALNDWRMKQVPDTRRRPEVLENFDDSQWDKADVQTESGPLAPGESAVFRTRFALSAQQMATESIAITIGSMDDEGWVYVNGHLAGESHDYSSQSSFEARKFLHEGENSIAVAIHNWDGPGGLNKGAALELSEKPEAPRWKRSAFNGLAQVIVQAGKDAGTLHLTAQADGLTGASIDITSANNSSPPLQP